MNDRIRRLQAVLREEGIDGAVYATSASMQYLLDDHGYRWQRTMYCGGLPDMWPEGLAGHFLNYPDRMLYIPDEGEPVLVATFAVARDMEHLPIRLETGYFHRLMDIMAPFLRGRRIAVGEACRPYLLAMLEEFAPKAVWTDGEQTVLGMRMVKDDKEIAALRRVARFTDEAMEKTVRILRPGVTKGEVEAYLARIGEEAGLRDVSFPPAALFVKSGSGMALGSDPADMALEPGTAVAFDFGYVMDGYCSDYGRSFYLGEAPKRYAEGYRALQTAQTELLRRIRPGVRMDLCRRVLEEVLDDCGGYAGNLRQNPVSGLMGHQIGIDVHEHPWIHDAQEHFFEPGMVMCIEPKLWFENVGYMRVEDMVLITEDGCESLTVFDRSRFELPV
ncbi:MAG: aminopeptidase P family protein [Clostridia bacterium]|nr:aminopeptidase P family protein [Clostridia bacterium]